MEEVIKGGVYKHYKGKLYRVLDVVRHSETLEEMVLYETLYECELGNLWVRPKEIFLSLHEGKRRFEFVEKTADPDYCKTLSAADKVF